MVEYKEHQNSDEDYDEFGRKKKKKTSMQNSENEEDDEEDEEGDLSKYDLWVCDEGKQDPVDKIGSTSSRSSSSCQKYLSPYKKSNLLEKAKEATSSISKSYTNNISSSKRSRSRSRSPAGRRYA